MNLRLAEQIIKVEVGTTWQLAGTRWLTPAKTVYDLVLGVNKTEYDLS